MKRRRKRRTGDGRRGPAAFERFYADLFGERWQALREALLEAGSHVELRAGLLAPYFLDAASLAVAAAVEVRPGMRVLDLCAAPGGKSLVLASQLAAPSGQQGAVRRPGELVANERSAARRARLHRVLDSHLPPEARALVRVTGHDAATWAVHEPSAYDLVLADVPCSSERHVIRSPGALDEWSPSRTRRLAQGAYAIGCAGADALVPGGELVYSTCALSPLENDAVVARIIDRAAGALELVDAGGRLVSAAARHPDLSPFPSGTSEQTERGRLFLPDRPGGLGPMYVSILRRRTEG